MSMALSMGFQLLAKKPDQDGMALRIGEASVALGLYLRDGEGDLEAIVALLDQVAP